MAHGSAGQERTIDERDHPSVTHEIVCLVIVRGESDERAPADARRVEDLRRRSYPHLAAPQLLKGWLKVELEADARALEREAAHEEDQEHDVRKDRREPCHLSAQVRVRGGGG